MLEATWVRKMSASLRLLALSRASRLQGVRDDAKDARRHHHLEMAEVLQFDSLCVRWGGTLHGQDEVVVSAPDCNGVSLVVS